MISYIPFDDGYFDATIWGEIFFAFQCYLPVTTQFIDLKCQYRTINSTEEVCEGIYMKILKTFT